MNRTPCASPRRPDPIQDLIEILAELVVTDYLREQAANDEESADPRKNPVAPHDRNAA